MSVPCLPRPHLGGKKEPEGPNDSHLSGLAPPVTADNHLPPPALPPCGPQGLLLAAHSPVQAMCPESLQPDVMLAMAIHSQLWTPNRDTALTHHRAHLYTPQGATSLHQPPRQLAGSGHPHWASGSGFEWGVYRLVIPFVSTGGSAESQVKRPLLSEAMRIQVTDNPNPSTKPSVFNCKTALKGTYSLYTRKQRNSDFWFW